MLVIKCIQESLNSKQVRKQMIQNKKDLIIYLQRDMSFYYKTPIKERIINRITSDPIYYIAKYIRLLRLEEYYYNARHDFIGKLVYLYYLRKKNRLGNKLGFKIPHNTIGAGLTIYHHGEIIVNENAKIGENCQFHGGNCIGNNGISDKSPIIGDGLDLGIGAKIIGDIKLGNNIRVGANAVVNKSFDNANKVLVGVPAHEIK